MTAPNYDKISDIIEKTLLSPSLYWQSLSLILCFVISYFFYRFTKKFLPPKTSKKTKTSYLVERYATPLLYSLSTLIFLTIGLTIYSQFFKETVLFLTTIKLVALFLFLRFLRISSGSSFIANAAGIFLMPALILDIFDLLQPTIEYLDSFAFKIGTIRISIYLTIKSFIVLLIVFWLASLVSKKSRTYIEKNRQIKSNTKGILIKFIDILVYAAVGIILLKTFGVDMTTLAVFGGAIGVGIGFGLQKIASNFISGIILLFEKAIEVGDMLELEGGTFGKVKHFSGRYTLIEALDGKEILLPNEDLITGKVINWTHTNSEARVEINLGVAYGSDLELVQKIMINCAKSHPQCLSDPEIECFVTQFADFDIKFSLFFWIADIVEGRALPKSDVLMSIWKEFARNGVKIPLPQREIFISQ